MKPRMGSGGVNNGYEEKVKNVQKRERGKRLRIGRNTRYCICHLVFGICTDQGNQGEA